MTDLNELIDLTFRVQERKRPDRHPYQVGILIGLACVATSQIIVGIPPASALYGAVDYSLMVALNTTLIVGSLLGLWGAALHRDRDPRLSLRLGMAGQFSVFVGTIAYSAIILGVTPPPYFLSVLSAMLGITIAYASAHRFAQQWKALRDVSKLVDIIQPGERDDAD